MPVITRHVDEYPDDEATLWRYMDLSRLLSIIERKQLWFSRADHLGDPYEGSLTEVRREKRDNMLKGLREFTREQEDWTSIEKDEETLLSEEMNKKKRERKWVFVNCWHLNEKESAAMWELYAKSNDAIAIKSTFQRLLGSVHSNKEDISALKIRYIDFGEDDMIQGDSTLKYLYKRRSFEHERELRLLFWDVPDLSEIDEQRPPGQYIDAKLELLIDEIRIAPTAPGWFADTVGRILDTYGFDNQIVSQSDLADDPLF